MSGRGWRPGDLGVTAKGRLALRRANDPDGWIDQDGAPWSTKKFPANVRPLVVIDLEDRGQVERLAKLCPEEWEFARDGETLREVVDQLQAALREFADPKPPKPEEPMGFAAVVVDSDGERWVSYRQNEEEWEQPWHNGQSDCWDDWSEINAVRVLSEGVKAGESA